MKKLVAGECHPDNIFELVDPTGFSEIEFEAEVVRALCCLFPEYLCGVFAGSFLLEGERHVADLALVHKSLSHWFVVEVEIAGHSLEHHILPQVRCFRYGDPEASCTTSLVRAFDVLTREDAERIVRYVPRYVVVVGNLVDASWSIALRALEIQYLAVSVYRDRNGRSAHEIEGRLSAHSRSLGFAKFSAVDNCLRMSRASGLMPGAIQLVDQFGMPTEWMTTEAGGTLWIRKVSGPALIPHDSYVQLLRTYDGRICLKL